MAAFPDSIGVTWALVAVVIGTLGFWAWSKLKPKYNGYNIPPFPVKKSFLLGHLRAWAKASEFENIVNFREKAGDIFSLDLAGNLVVVVSGYDAIKEVMVNRWTEAPDRPTNPASYILKEVDVGILNGKGETWKSERATALTILRSFGMGKNILAEKIQEEFEIFMEKIAEFKGKPVDIKLLVNVSISNIICSIIVGKRFDHDDPYFVKLMQNLNYAFQRAPGFALTPFVVIAKCLPFDLFGFKTWMDHVLAIRSNFSDPHIKEAKENFANGEALTSYITSYLEKMRQENELNSSSLLNDEDLVATIRGLFVAGTETVSTTIYWCILLCLHHPEIHDKVYKEISEQVGHGRRVTMNDRANLRYLDAAIKESQRYASVVPLLPRKVLESFKMNGYNIPKDTVILLNMHSSLHDAKVWGDPENFRPERFLDAKGNLINQEELVPFGLGKRSCPGEALAKMELFIFMSSLFQRFRFEPEDPSGELPPIEKRFSLVLSPKNYKVRRKRTSVLPDEPPLPSLMGFLHSDCARVIAERGGKQMCKVLQFVLCSRQLIIKLQVCHQILITPANELRQDLTVLMSSSWFSTIARVAVDIGLVGAYGQSTTG
ncbi:cytochrome p450 2j5 [Plakobranchus ocellatus]|uniref:Cytochrome p450 2j5 n=1 Tax=Plakobranchus ocellatus TaxID=259542 RepID=A0AAV4A5Q8_9GAST|nr:cytochrome p450 2j5 [Plakobranchus ocellatus]